MQRLFSSWTEALTPGEQTERSGLEVPSDSRIPSASCSQCGDSSASYTSAGSTEISARESNGLLAPASDGTPGTLTTHTPIVARCAKIAAKAVPSAGFVRCASNPARVASLLVLFLAEPGQRHKQDLGAENLYESVDRSRIRLALAYRCRGGPPQAGTIDHRERTFPVVRDSRLSAHVIDEHGGRICRIFVVVDDQNSSLEPALIGSPFSAQRPLASSSAAAE